MDDEIVMNTKTFSTNGYKFIKFIAVNEAVEFIENQEVGSIIAIMNPELIKVDRERGITF